MSKPRDKIITSLEYLGQKWSSKKPIIKDYACNTYGDRIGALDVLLEYLPKDSKDKAKFELIRKMLVNLGEALYIQRCDPFTQLCIKIGSTMRRASFDRNKTNS